MTKRPLKEVIIHEGHAYREHSSNPQYRLLYCTERQGKERCKGAIKIRPNGDIEVVRQHEAHKGIDPEVKRARWCLKHEAGKQKEKRPQAVIREVTKVIGEEIMTSMGTKSALRGVIRRARRDEGCRKGKESVEETTASEMKKQSKKEEESKKDEDDNDE